MPSSMQWITVERPGTRLDSCHETAWSLVIFLCGGQQAREKCVPTWIRLQLVETPCAAVPLCDGNITQAEVGDLTRYTIHAALMSMARRGKVPQ